MDYSKMEKGSRERLVAEMVENEGFTRFSRFQLTAEIQAGIDSLARDGWVDVEKDERLGDLTLSMSNKLVALVSSSDAWEDVLKAIG